MYQNNENLILENKYDNEFIGLLNEVGIRMKYYNNNKNTIRSWISLLILPCITEKEKKNRNLYIIKLLNQMVNGYLNYPFNTYAKENDIKILSPINIKAELTSKFFREINFRKVECLGKIRQKQFLLTYPQLLVNNTVNNDIITNNNSQELENYRYNKKQNENCNANKKIIKNLDNTQNINIINISENSTNLNSRQLNDIIDELEEKIKESDLIIKNQSEEITKLKSMITELYKKENCKK